MPFDATTFVETEAQRVLREARDIIASGHWTKGAFMRCVEDEVTYCLIGAVRKAATSNAFGGDPLALDFVSEAVPERFCGDIAYFNDNRMTQQADVLAVLDRAYILAASPAPSQT